MPGSPTAPGRSGARYDAPDRVAFHRPNGVGTRIKIAFAAQWLAYAIPYRRFASTLAVASARLGADVVCYSFIVADFHHLLLAGLPAHSGTNLVDVLKAQSFPRCCPNCIDLQPSHHAVQRLLPDLQPGLRPVPAAPRIM